MGELRKLSASQLSLHTTKDDCWLLINGKVYDVTKFLEEHPGGEDVLLHASASGDATDGFENVGHSSLAMNLMETYLIGSIEGYVAPPAPFNESSNATSSTEPTFSPGFFDYLFAFLALGFAIFGWFYLTFIAEKTE